MKRMLVNRAEFLSRIGQTLSRADDDALAALLFLNVDHFQVVNDSLGARAGRRVLEIIGQRLEMCLRQDDVLGRLRGDEFAILLPPPVRVEEAATLAERIGERLRQPVSIADQQLTLTTSIGIAVAQAADSPAALLRNADMAMCQAKDNGRGGYRVFDPQLRRHAWDKMRLETELRQAVERDEFVVHYQPLVDLATQRFAGAEALVRWQHPRRGLVAPNEFIPIAEETGVIVAIGQIVLQQACEEAASWETDDAFSPTISVNISARQLEDADGLIASVDNALSSTGLEPRRLKLEITESSVMRDPELAIAILWALKGRGIQLAVDDFGTGYSSLAYLKRFPIDTVKIDRSFVQGVVYLPEDQAIVAATVAFARALGMSMVAEGVEDEEQAAILRQLGCDLGQGFLWGRPAPAAALKPRLIRALPRAA